MAVWGNIELEFLTILIENCPFPLVFLKRNIIQVFRTGGPALWTCLFLSHKFIHSQFHLLTNIFLLIFFCLSHLSITSIQWTVCPCFLIFWWGQWLRTSANEPDKIKVLSLSCSKKMLKVSRKNLTNGTNILLCLPQFFS